jgi:hypothetical protein
MAESVFPSQWDGLLKNVGKWEGSFTRMDLNGKVIEDTSTLVHLEALPGAKTIRQVNRYFRQDGSLQSEQEYFITSMSRGLLFFENGAFSQGSMQLAPFSEFGGEFGLIHENRRLRLVLLYNSDNQFSRFTLIREHLADSGAQPSPDLKIDDLLGEWQGEAIQLDQNHFTVQTYTTNLVIKQEGSQIVQTTQAGDFQRTSSAEIIGSRLDFGNVQVRLLPGGASCVCPTVAELGKPLFLEIGWLIAPDVRQRITRNFNAKGEWTGVTLITERKTAP